MILPKILQEERLLSCRECDCTVDVANPCASCPKNKWGPLLCRGERQAGSTFAPALFVESGKDYGSKPPSLTKMVTNVMQSASKWVARGMQHTDEATLKMRIETCQSCKFWNPKGFNNTGRCMKCGCSTWAKLRMATEKCPIGKW